MTVTVVMHGTLRRFLPEGAARATLDLRDGATVSEVLAELGAEAAEHETWLVARNEAIAERDHVLAPGDVLDCFEPLAGGAGRATRENGPMPVRYVITTLKSGVKPEDYERWLVDYDYKVARSLPSIVSYRTHRIEGPINGAETAGWSYIERIEIRDVDQYQQDIASPAGQELMRQLYGTYLERSKNIFFWSEEITD